MAAAGAEEAAADPHQGAAVADHPPDRPAQEAPQAAPVVWEEAVQPPAREVPLAVPEVSEQVERRLKVA